jgi:hypothetical protein
MPQLARFHETFASKTTGLPLASKSVTVYREGATFVSGSGTTPATLTVRNNGKIVAGDTVFIGAVTGTTYTVDSATATTVVVSGFVGTLSPTAGDRIVPSNDLPTLYEDDQGGASKTNPLTTSATGLAQAWIATGAYDHILSGSGVDTVLFQGITRAAENYPHYNVKTYGATGDGTTDDSTAIQVALDDLELQGGGVLFFPLGTYLLGTGLTVEDESIRIVGSGRASILKANSAITMLTIGPDSGASTANAGNVVSSLQFDFNSKAATGIHWNRWGQIGWTEHVHFVNPVAGSIGITTADSSTINELVFEDINWFYNPPLTGGATVGTGIIIDCNNCKIRSSTFIGATVGVDILTTVSAEPLLIEGNRFRANTRSIRANGTSPRGLNIKDNRFEGNTIETFAVDLEGADATTNRIVGVSLTGNRFSSTNGVRLKNIKGILLAGNTIISLFASPPTTFITDGGDVSQISSINVINAPGITIATFPATITDVEATGSAEGLYNLMRRTQFGDGVDAPAQANVLVYATRAGEAYLVARDSANDAEAVFGANSANIVMGARTNDPAHIVTNNTNRVKILANGTTEFLLALGMTDGITAPTTKGGIAYLYVDTADGDLKVKFGDGTVKTLATDT